MERFIISKDVETNNIDSDKVAAGGISNLITGFGVASAKAVEYGLTAGGAGIAGYGFLTPWAVVVPIVYQTATVLAKALKDKTLHTINSADELEQYRNCTSNEWKKGTLYIEHPHRQKYLIEASLYKNYIIKEMIADVFDFISDRLDLSKLVIGLVSSGKLNAKAKVPVQDLYAEAKIKCSLDKGYYFSVNNTKAPISPKNDYIWISQFPDVISAVKHKAQELEITQTVNMELDIKAGLVKKLSGNVGVQKNYKFYITYSAQSQ